jgi:hypothetical protein
LQALNAVLNTATTITLNTALTAPPYIRLNACVDAVFGIRSEEYFALIAFANGAAISLNLNVYMEELRRKLKRNDNEPVYEIVALRLLLF